MPTTLKSRLPAIQAELPLKVTAAIKLGTERMAADASFRAPVETGELKQSIEARDKGIYAAWYYFFAEFGTAHESARPFLIPAVEAGRDDLLSDVRAALERL